MESLCLDKLFDVYESTKRIISKFPTHYYDLEKNNFFKIKNPENIDGIAFINSYELCVKVIEEYLNQPSVIQYKPLFEKEVKTSKNYVVCFLWFFEHIDGCYDFEKFEFLIVEKVLKKWCKRNGLAFIESIVYCKRNTEDGSMC